MSEIEWVVGELYEDRVKNIYKLIYDGRKEPSLHTLSRGLIFSLKGDVAVRFLDGRSQFDENDIIKKHEPKKSKKDLALEILDKSFELGGLHESLKGLHFCDGVEAKNAYLECRKLIAELIDD